MVLANCMPNYHMGDFDFPCSNKKCQNGLNATRSLLCEKCCFQDKSKTTLLHCFPCHLKFQKEDKKESEDSYDDDEGYFTIIEKEEVKVETPPALLLFDAFFRSDP